MILHHWVMIHGDRAGLAKSCRLFEEVVYADFRGLVRGHAALRLWQERIGREEWRLTKVYRDAAISGASGLRPGYQALLDCARQAECDVIVAEALNRLSRDPKDVAGLFKRSRFAGVRIVTLAEGEISELHVGLKGTKNAFLLKDLAIKPGGACAGG